MVWAPRTALSVVTLNVLAVALAGCTVSLRTAPDPPPGPIVECNLALISGVLIQEAASGLGLRDGAGNVRGVVWPFGYSAGREFLHVVLIDRAGQIVAREGDRVEMTGGYGNGDIAYPCSDPHLKIVT